MAVKTVFTDYQLLKEMTPEQHRQALSKLAKRANNRIYNIRKQGLESPALKMIEKSLFDREGRKYFSESGKGMSDIKVLIELANIIDFLNRKTSTITGIKEVEERFFSTMEERYRIKVDKEDRKMFYDFMEHVREMSHQYYIPSNELVEMFAELSKNQIEFEDMSTEWDSFIKANRESDVKDYAESVRNKYRSRKR
ncbi:hypothetical protein [Bacteroides acidifaciens]|uniref:hypothetical protein n=1 Tax=Bacteroides acidifaciens TaxID=85831 RepID=UPI0025AE2002|nr:hypothetical protein [Bacteroides acidifaciens]